VKELFGGTAPANAPGALAGERERGVRFTVTAAVDVDMLHWFRADAPTSPAPSTVRLWEELTSSTAELLATAVSVEDTLAVGWQDAPLGGPITLVTGKTYCVSGCHPTGFRSSNTAEPNIPVATAPFAWHASPGRDKASPCGFPPTIDNTTAYGFDISAVEPPPPADSPGEDGDPPTNENISARIAQWQSLDPDVQTHEEDGIPWFLKTLLQATKDQLQDTWDLIQALGSTVEAISWGNPLAVLASIPNVLKSIWTDTPTLGVPRMETSILDRVGLAQTDLTTLVESIPTDPRAEQDVVGMDELGWVSTGTQIGDGGFHWDHPADRYVLTITAYGSHRPFNDVGGIPYWLHRGFWAVVDFDRVGHFYPIVGHKHMLYEVGSRMQGVLLGLDGDLEWTLTAYDYVGG
jgi:hypothetical protein